ncbi:MAG: class I SAM-dependent methyltransferase [Candidatus Odinarchaeota archaeon]
MREIKYDKFSQIYDLSRGINTKTVDALIKLTHINSNSLVLDMGCGTGNYTAALNHFTKNIIGIDLSLAMINKAVSKFPNLKFINGNIINLPFRSNLFNGLYAIQVIHHIEDKFVFLKEVYRILRKKGYIAIHTCSHNQINTYWYTYYFPEGLKLELKRFLDIKKLTSLLKKIGFSNIGVKVCYDDSVILNQKPEKYLDKDFRNGDSMFALLTENQIEAGCKKLKEDIKSGVINKVLKGYEKRIDIFGGSSIVYAQKT